MGIWILPNNLFIFQCTRNGTWGDCCIRLLDKSEKKCWAFSFGMFWIRHIGNSILSMSTLFAALSSVTQNPDILFFTSLLMFFILITHLWALFASTFQYAMIRSNHDPIGYKMLSQINFSVEVKNWSQVTKRHNLEHWFWCVRFYIKTFQILVIHMVVDFFR